MRKNYLINGSIGPNTLWKNFYWSQFLLAGVLASVIGVTLGLFGPYALATAIAIVGMYLVIIFRQDELAAALVIGVHLYLDWYLAIRVAGLLMTVFLLLLYFLARSSRYPWTQPRFLWLWFLFLVSTILPSIRGASTLYDALFYYPNVVLSSFIMFWLGTVISRDVVSLRRFLQMLTVLATLLAIHTLIEVVTGVVLFSTSHYDPLIDSSAYQVAGTAVHRAESFFIDPNWNGTFMAMMSFIPFGLLIESTSFLKKVFYVVSMVLILMALLSTYSNGAWIGAFAGIIVFVLFVGRTRYRVLVIMCILVLAAVVIVGFSSQLSLQLQHATDPQEVILRVGAWQTALRVIQAFPLTGVGLGLYTYLAHSQPYRVPAQIIPLAHPHDSYLELAAMGGLPVCAIFMALLLTAWWSCWRTWIRADARTRSLLAGGIATSMALSANSISINGWTLPPLCAVGWMILGAISSPLLTRKLSEALASKQQGHR